MTQKHWIECLQMMKKKKKHRARCILNWKIIYATIKWNAYLRAAAAPAAAIEVEYGFYLDE